MFIYKLTQRNYVLNAYFAISTIVNGCIWSNSKVHFSVVILEITNQKLYYSIIYKGLIDNVITFNFVYYYFRLIENEL